MLALPVQKLKPMPSLKRTDPPLRILPSAMKLIVPFGCILMPKLGSFLSLTNCSFPGFNRLRRD